MHYACVTHELDLHDVIGRFARTHVQFVRNYTSEYCALAQINLIDDLAEGAYILHAVQVSFILASNLGSCRISDSLAQTKGGVVDRHVTPRPPNSRYDTPTNSNTSCNDREVSIIYDNMNE